MVTDIGFGHHSPFGCPQPEDVLLGLVVKVYPIFHLIVGLSALLSSLIGVNNLFPRIPKRKPRTTSILHTIEGHIKRISVVDAKISISSEGNTSLVFQNKIHLCLDSKMSLWKSDHIPNRKTVRQSTSRTLMSLTACITAMLVLRLRTKVGLESIKVSC